MQASVQTTSTNTSASTSTEKSRYARCIDASKRIRWEIDRDVIRGRRFDLSKRFLPNGLSRVDELAFLSPDDRRFLTQVQGRSYANIFGLVERFIAAMVVDVSREYLLGDQVALEALVRFTDEEIKHQEMFRRIERMLGEQMPAGYAFAPEPNAVARAVLSKSTWAVLGLTCHIEMFVQLHYRESIDGEQDLCPLWKDVFLFHWKEESQHAILDELEWVREDAALTKAQRDAAVDDLIALVGAVDGILQAQAKADAAYFASACARRLDDAEREAVATSVLRAYRWQYIVSGVQQPRFAKALGGLIDAEQGARIEQALAPIMQSASVQ
jgi:hypothetical protein